MIDTSIFLADFQVFHASFIAGLFVGVFIGHFTYSLFSWFIAKIKEVAQSKKRDII